MQHLPTRQFSSMCDARFRTTRPGISKGFGLVFLLFPSKLSLFPQSSHAEVSRCVWDFRYGDIPRENMFITSCSGSFPDRRQHTSRVTCGGHRTTSMATRRQQVMWLTGHIWRTWRANDRYFYRSCLLVHYSVPWRVWIRWKSFYLLNVVVVGYINAPIIHISLILLKAVPLTCSNDAPVCALTIMSTTTAVVRGCKYGHVCAVTV